MAVATRYLPPFDRGLFLYAGMSWQADPVCVVCCRYGSVALFLNIAIVLVCGTQPAGEACHVIPYMLYVNNAVRRVF